MASSEDSVTFGQHYAILNLDWMSVLINAIEETAEGKARIASLSRWNDVVHRMANRPLTIFTTLAFSRGQPEVEDNKPFARLIASFGSFEEDSPNTAIDERFEIDERDVVLRKTRWSATTGSNLEQILKAQGIDTVVISGLTLSGAIVATVYRLFDLDYNVYVIEDNVLDLPVSHNEACSKVILGTLLPKMNLKVISLEQAISALGE